MNSEPLFDRNLSFSLADYEPRKLKTVEYYEGEPVGNNHNVRRDARMHEDDSPEPERIIWD